MPLLDASVDQQFLNKIIHELPQMTERAAREKYGKGEVKDGELFLVIEDDEAVKNDPEYKGDHWKCGMILMNRFIFVDYDQGVFTAARLDILKRKGVAKLLWIAETKWVPTASMPYIPQRYQNLQTGKRLYTEEAVKSDFDEARHDNEVIDPEFAKDEEVKVEEAPLAPTE